MNRLWEKKPTSGQVVVVYLGRGEFDICTFVGINTADGWKDGFVNLNRVVIEKRSIRGWSGIPTEDETIISAKARPYCLSTGQIAEVENWQCECGAVASMNEVSFKPSGIGMIVAAKCKCGREINLSEIGSW